MLNDDLHTKEELNEFAKAVVRGAESNLIKMGKRGSGGLYNSLDHAIEANSKGYTIKFFAEEYAEYVDKGVSGTERKYVTPYSFTNKMPPRLNILAWVNKKRMRLRDDKGKFKKGGQNTLAFLIQRHIFKKGIKPSLFFTKPFEQYFEELPDHLGKAYVLDVEKYIQRKFTGENDGTNI